MAERFFAEELLEEGALARVGQEEARHMHRVMRLRPGDVVILLHEDGLIREGTIESLDDRQSLVRVQRILPDRSEPETEMILVQSLCKGDKMELIIQKAVELGVRRILPLKAGRSDVRLGEDRAEKRALRWQRIAREAVKQCRRAVVPEIGAPVGLRQCLDSLPENTLVIALYEEETAQSLRQVLSRNPVGPVALLVGPEGGFQAEEMDLVRKAGGITATLGPRILRTETAGLCGLSCILYQRGELE